jgi:Cu+-exporting ATPase
MVIFDKTGTLTKGEPSVTNIVSFKGYSKNKALELAATVEKNSEHPLAEAVLKAAIKEGVNIPNIERFEAVPGKGVKAIYNSYEILLGNKKLMEEANINIEEAKELISKFEEEGKTVMILSVNRKLAGVISVMDTIKNEAFEVVKQLKNMKLKVAMLTGDNEKTAKAIAKQIGIDMVFANVLPWEKAEIIKKLQEKGEVIAMVGDGINDAPALAQADIGIAIGSGTDVAKEAGGIILVKDNLLDVTRGILLSKAVMKKIKQNLFWAFLYNATLVPVAAAGLLINYGGPVIAASAMALSSLFVVSNAATLKLLKL